MMCNCKLLSLPLSCTSCNFYWLDKVNRSIGCVCYILHIRVVHASLSPIQQRSPNPDIQISSVTLMLRVVHTAGRSQSLTPGWARYKHFLNPSLFSCRFSHFSSNFLHFLPHFGLPGGRLAYPGRPWLRHWTCPSNFIIHRAFILLLQPKNFWTGLKPDIQIFELKPG